MDKQSLEQLIADEIRRQYSRDAEEFDGALNSEHGWLSRASRDDEGDLEVEIDGPLNISALVRTIIDYMK